MMIACSAILVDKPLVAIIYMWYKGVKECFPNKYIKQKSL